MEKTLLLQFVEPRSDGARASGLGFMRVGQGHYNCDDGTSYGPEAAPVIHSRRTTRPETASLT